jgi:hypothetical protein
MASWLTGILGAWLLLSVLVSLGLARAMSLSNRSGGPTPPPTLLVHVALPATPPPVGTHESAMQHRDPVPALSH